MSTEFVFCNGKLYMLTEINELGQQAKWRPSTDLSSPIHTPFQALNLSPARVFAGSRRDE
jgi:hypothetical protein